MGSSLGRIEVLGGSWRARQIPRELQVGPTATAFRVTGSAGLDRGYAFADLPRPLSTSTLGTAIVGQWLVFEPSNLDFAATQKHQLRLQ